MKDNIQTEMDNIDIVNQQNVYKELYYHNKFTGYTFQRKNTIHKYDNRRTFIQSKAILHINEKVTKSYKFNYQII